MTCRWCFYFAGFLSRHWAHDHWSSFIASSEVIISWSCHYTQCLVGASVTFA